jgi:hypothetical protein
MRAEPADPAMPDAYQAVLSAEYWWTYLPAERTDTAVPDAYQAVLPA